MLVLDQWWLNVSPGMCHHKAISEGTGHSFTKPKGVLMERQVLKYPLHQPPLHCHSWFDMEGEAAVLLPTLSVMRAGLSLLDLCKRRAVVLPAWPPPLPLLCFGLIISVLQHRFIVPVLKSHLSQKMSSHTMQPADILSVEEGRGWFWDWGPGLAFRNCSAAALLHSVKHAVYLLSFLCPSALAQGGGEWEICRWNPGPPALGHSFQIYMWCGDDYGRASGGRKGN